MEFIVVPAVSFIASLLSFYSGFGLGTMLLPAFALFFPVNTAVALTAVVHLLNNLVKGALVFKRASRDVVLRFGLVAIPASLLGAYVLSRLNDLTPLSSYDIFGRSFFITPIKLIIAVSMVLFVSWEVFPPFQKITFDRKFLPVGGVFSGFFGGLSGQQGPLRGAFLVKTGLTPDGFIASSAVIAVLTDIPRLSIYFTSFSLAGTGKNLTLLAVATGAAILGVWLGNAWSRQISMKTIKILVSVMLFVIALALGAGLI
ncbi:MAG: hypothetical protein A2Z29_01740 [Chloroflexi bacterium RBG_16_56_11]|nr:MAG: hypothetical protein A2Z29_01740 [Chloroflexi bacterium RBG_16_56_11]